MYRSEAYRKAKKHNKEYKAAIRIISFVAGHRGGCSTKFICLEKDTINMLQSEGYEVRKLDLGYLVLWLETLNY